MLLILLELPVLLEILVILEILVLLEKLALLDVLVLLKLPVVLEVLFLTCGVLRASGIFISGSESKDFLTLLPCLVEMPCLEKGIKEDATQVYCF